MAEEESKTKSRRVSTTDDMEVSALPRDRRQQGKAGTRTCRGAAGRTSAEGGNGGGVGLRFPVQHAHRPPGERVQGLLRDSSLRHALGTHSSPQSQGFHPVWRSRQRLRRKRPPGAVVRLRKPAARVGNLLRNASSYPSAWAARWPPAPSESTGIRCSTRM